MAKSILKKPSFKPFSFFTSLTPCLVLSLVLSIAPTPAYADKILLLGDSLSAAYGIPWESGWAQLLASDLAEDHELINASVGGETTGGGMARLQTLLEEHQPDWVIIELGGNDGLRGYPLKVIRNNLKQIGNMVTKANAKPIYFGIQIPPNYGQRYNDAFSALFNEVADEFNAPYLSLFSKEIAVNPDLMLDDGLHPSERAQPLIKKHVTRFLLPVLAKD